MISPQASIPRLLTSMYDEDTSCPKIPYTMLSTNISKISGRINISIMYDATRRTRQCSIA